MIPHLINITDLAPTDISKIIETTVRIKKGELDVSRSLAGRHFGLLFEKPSTRTRVSLEVGIGQMGGKSTFLSWNDIQLSRGEDLPDTARVLSRYLDAVVIRTKDHRILEEIKNYGSIPVINALSDLSHPMQILADFVTMAEHDLDITKSRVCFIGDGTNNVCSSLAAGVVSLGGHMTICSPPEYLPQAAEESNGLIKLETDIEKATKDADVIYTDVWISMGDEKEAETRKKLLSPYQLNRSVVENANEKVMILHCLPAIKGQEITEDVFESPHSKIFEQAENRLHAQKALLHLMFS